MRTGRCPNRAETELEGVRSIRDELELRVRRLLAELEFPRSGDLLIGAQLTVNGLEAPIRPAAPEARPTSHVAPAGIKLDPKNPRCPDEFTNVLAPPAPPS
jgi:hypothetical protein